MNDTEILDCLLRQTESDILDLDSKLNTYSKELEIARRRENQEDIREFYALVAICSDMRRNARYIRRFITSNRD